MSYNGSGVFSINTSGQPVVTGTSISSTAFNAFAGDLATGLTNALCKDGQSTPTANIKLGGFKLTGIGAPSVAGDALMWGGAATVGALVVSSGCTQTGSTKQSVTAAAALDLDLSTADFFTKSISSNSTFTFSNTTASVGQAFILQITVSSAATTAWPASVKWASGTAPTLGNGAHVLGFITFNGGTSWFATWPVNNAS